MEIQGLKVEPARVQQTPAENSAFAGAILEAAKDDAPARTNVGISAGNPLSVTTTTSSAEGWVQQSGNPFGENPRVFPSTTAPLGDDATISVSDSGSRQNVTVSGAVVKSGDGDGINATVRYSEGPNGSSADLTLDGRYTASPGNVISGSITHSVPSGETSASLSVSSQVATGVSVSGSVDKSDGSTYVTGSVSLSEGKERLTVSHSAELEGPEFSRTSVTYRQNIDGGHVQVQGSVDNDGSTRLGVSGGIKF